MLTDPTREVMYALEQERLRHAARRYQIRRLQHETGRTFRQRATRMLAAVPHRPLRRSRWSVGPGLLRPDATSEPRTTSPSPHGT